MNKVEVLRTATWLPQLVGLCSEEVPELRVAGHRCLTALSTHDPAKGPLVRAGALAALRAAAQSGRPALQEPAAAALANLCSDPTHIMDVVGCQGAQAAIILMARCPDREVQVGSPCSLMMPRCWALQTLHPHDVPALRIA